MAKKNGRVRINRKKGSGRRPLVSLLIIVILLCLVFFLLEKLKKPVPEKAAPQPPPVVHKTPKVTSEQPPAVQDKYSSAVKLPLPERPVDKPQVIEPQKPAGGRGTVAIIIDDMGSNLREVEALMSIDVPLTFAVIPGLGKAREVAEAAHDRSYEVMIHMPMEPQDYPQRRLEKNGLLLAESDVEIRRRVSEYVRSIPHAAGANNHMGSRFTENDAKMEAALAPLGERGFFFIDSKTTPRSVGIRVAGRLGMKSGARDVFLDNEQDVGEIRKQIRQLAKTAEKRGSAIGICHPHAATIKALAAELPELEKAGITFVSVSRLVR